MGKNELGLMLINRISMFGQRWCLLLGILLILFKLMISYLIALGNFFLVRIKKNLFGK